MPPTLDLPDQCVIYQNIFTAHNAGIIRKLGNPGYYNDHSYRRGWNGYPIIAYGGNNESDGNGALVTVPEGYEVVWVRVLGDRWNVIEARNHESKNLPAEFSRLGRWSGGYRKSNAWTPDGGLKDTYWNVHEWVPIPTSGARRIELVSKPHTSSSFWVSGLAFSKNPWNHALQSAVGIHWAINGGNGVGWSTHNWNEDQLARLNTGSNWELRVPVIPSGRDKLLYIVEHNNSWMGTMHRGITVNGKRIERFRASWLNPFATHINSKRFSRYLAARVPVGLIPKDARHISVRVDMRGTNNHIHFREIGTHDLEPGHG